MSIRSVWRAAVRDEWDGLQRITRDIRAADIVTIANALMGLLAAVAVTEGRITLAATLVLLGILLDGMDGAVARLSGGGGPLGGFLDTLADTITFAVAPAVIAVAVAGRPPLWLLLAAGFYVTCVMLRLARFEALREKKHMAYFSGLSSPGGAAVVVACVLLGLPLPATATLMVVAGAFMVSRVRYPKLRGAVGAVAVLILITVISTAVWFPDRLADVSWTMMAFMVAYLTAGPFYVLRRFGATGRPA